MRVTIAQVQEAWGQGAIAGALLMDVAALPKCCQRMLVTKDRNAGVGKCLVSWADSFMRDRRVIMSVDGQDGEGWRLPRGSPRAPLGPPQASPRDPLGLSCVTGPLRSLNY